MRAMANGPSGLKQLDQLESMVNLVVRAVTISIEAYETDSSSLSKPAGYSQMQPKAMTRMQSHTARN